MLSIKTLELYVCIDLSSQQHSGRRTGISSFTELSFILRRKRDNRLKQTSNKTHIFPVEHKEVCMKKHTWSSPEAWQIILNFWRCVTWYACIIANFSLFENTGRQTYFGVIKGFKPMKGLIRSIKWIKGSSYALYLLLCFIFSKMKCVWSDVIWLISGYKFQVPEDCGATSVGERNMKILVLSNGLMKVELPPWTSWKADALIISPSSERIDEGWLFDEWITL